MPPPVGMRVQKFLPSSDESASSSSDEKEAPKPDTRIQNFTARKYQSASGSQDQLLGLNDRPPIKPRKKNPGGKCVKNGASRDRLTGLFTMDKMAYDVVLEDMTLIMNLCDGQARNAGERRKSLSKQNSKSDLLAGQSVIIPLSKIYAVNMVRAPHTRLITTRRGSMDISVSDQMIPGACQGIMVLTYERKETSCRYEERSIFLKHPSDVICQEWVDKMKEKLTTFKERPRKMMVLIQVFSGRKNTRDVYHDKVRPILGTANIDVEVIELDHKEHIKQIVTHLDFDEYDCVAVVGGDGTVKTLVHHLLCRVQEDNHVSQEPDFTPVPCRMPIGIIPTGVTNNVARTMHGLEDIYTACIHIVLGHSIQVDIASIFLEDKFRRWAFTALYGIHGNIARYTDRTRGRPAQILDHAYRKALSKNKLRAHDCEVRYVPVEDKEAGNPMDEVICRIGCETCENARSEGGNQDSWGTDEVTAFDPLALSGNSNSFTELKSRDHGPDKWRTMKGSFMSVGVYCYPQMCEHTPQGQSKFTHYADGNMDLVCIREASRKDFIRYFKRTGSSKNQFDFPFVETLRVRQVQLRQRVDITWKHKDHDYDELSLPNRRKMSKSKTTDDVRTLDGCDSDIESDDSSDDATSSTRDNASSRAANDDDVDEFEANETKKKGDKTKEKSRLSIFSRQGSLLDLARRSPKSETKSMKSRRQSEPKTVTKTTLSEMEARKRKEKKVKKEKSKKAEDMSNMRALWNVDGDLEYESDLHIRVHHRLVTFCGHGIYEDAELGDCKFHYLPVV